MVSILGIPLFVFLVFPRTNVVLFINLELFGYFFRNTDNNRLYKCRRVNLKIIALSTIAILYIGGGSYREQYYRISPPGSYHLATVAYNDCDGGGQNGLRRCMATTMAARPTAAATVVCKTATSSGGCDCGAYYSGGNGDDGRRLRATGRCCLESVA